MSKDAHRSWVYMFSWQGRQREMGLGAYPLTTLAEARESRDRWRKVLMDGRNPIEVRKSGKAVLTEKTFGACAAELFAAKSSHQVSTVAVLSVLKPLWQAIPETASRLRGRIEAVLDFAKARGWRSGENRAARRGHLALILPKRGKLSRSHHAAMPYQNLPEFIGKLREHKSMPAMALEFAILTAARSGEVLGARWDEFDLGA